jgi:hypothetical protein
VVFDRVLTQQQTHDGSLTAANVVTSFINHCETLPVATNSSAFTCTDGNQVAQQSVLLPIAPTAARIINENTGDTLSYNSTGPNGTSAGTCSTCATNGQYRIEVDNSGTPQRYDLDVIQARAGTGPKVTASVVDSTPSDPTSGTFTLTLQPATGQPTVIVFQKAACAAGAGQCSTGGTINVAGAGADQLSTTVQAMSYSDSGPVWSK